MLTATCILQVKKTTGEPRIYAADNVKGVRQNDPGSWIIEVPRAPEGYTWIPQVTVMNPRALANGTNLTVLANELGDIEITTDEGPHDDTSIYVAAQLAHVVWTATGLSAIGRKSSHPEDSER